MQINPLFFAKNNNTNKTFCYFKIPVLYIFAFTNHTYDKYENSGLFSRRRMDRICFFNSDAGLLFYERKGNPFMNNT